MTNYDPRRAAADFLGTLTDRELRDFLADVREGHDEMQAFARQLFRTDRDARSPWKSPTDRND